MVAQCLIYHVMESEVSGTSLLDPFSQIWQIDQLPTIKVGIPRAITMVTINDDGNSIMITMVHITMMPVLFPII